MLNFNSNLCTQFNLIFYTFNLKQVINEPARVTNTNGSMLDLIFVNFETENETCEAGVKDIQISDHLLIYYKISNNLTSISSKKSVMPWNLIYFEDNIDTLNFLIFMPPSKLSP